MSRLRTYQDYRRAIASAEAMAAEAEAEADGDPETGLAPSFAEELAARSFRAHADRLRAELARYDDDSLPGHELDFVFEGAPVRGHRMDTEFMGHMLLSVQHLVRSVAASDAGRSTNAGPFPAGLRRATALDFAGSFDGSFGMRLEAVNDQPELTGGASIAPTVRTVLDLLAAVSEPAEALTRVGELGPRARKTYRELVSQIGRAQANVRVEWPGMGGVQRVEVRHYAAQRLVAALKDIRVRADGRYVVGVLDEASRRKGRFGFTTADDEHFDGLVETDLIPQVKEFYDRGPCRAYILTREVEQLQTGAIRRSHRLQELLPLDAPMLRAEEHFEEVEDTSPED